MKKLLIICSIVVYSISSFAQLKKLYIKFDEEHSTLYERNIEEIKKQIVHIKDEKYSLMSAGTVHKDELGITYYDYYQYYNRVKIFNSIIKLKFKNEKLISAHGLYANDIIDQKIQYSERETKNSLWSYLRKINESKKVDEKEIQIIGEPELLYTHISTQDKSNGFQLCYMYTTFCATEPGLNLYIFISVTDSEIKKTESSICAANGTAERNYFDRNGFGHNYQFPISTTLNTNGKYILKEQGTTRCNIQTYGYNKGIIEDNDNFWGNSEHNINLVGGGVVENSAAQMAHYGAEQFYDYFKTVHNRSSFDGQNSSMFSTLLYVSDSTLLNSQWSYSLKEAFFFINGAQNGDIFQPMVTPDWVSHEFGHGIAGSLNTRLLGRNEEGAINEGLSDIWGYCVEAYINHPAFKPYQIGEQITSVDSVTYEFGLSNGQIPSTSYCVRNIANPKQRMQPDTKEGEFYFKDPFGITNDNNDSGYVHQNCSIMSHWFYILANGKSGTNDLGNFYNVNAIGLDAASKIIYKAETESFHGGMTFADARDYTIDAAMSIYGQCSEQAIATMEAWYAVGVGNSFDHQNQESFVYDDINSWNNPFNVIYVDGSSMIDYSDVYYSFSKINSYQKILPSTHFSLLSNTSIELGDGFDAQNGCDFEAKIMCGSFNKLAVAGNPPKEAPSKDRLEDNSISCSISPNPFTANVTIELFNQSDTEKKQVAIVSQSGQILKELIFCENKFDIDLSLLPDGIYFVNIKNNKKETISKKIIKNAK